MKKHRERGEKSENMGNHNCSCGAAVYQAAEKKAQKSGKQAVEAGLHACRDGCDRRTPDRAGNKGGSRAIERSENAFLHRILIGI